MADAWDAVSSDPEFQALPSNQKDAVRLHFFQNVVAPNVPPEHLQDAQHSFFTDTQPAPAAQSILEKGASALSGPNLAQGMAGLQEGATAGISKPDYVGGPAPWTAPGGIAQHLSRIGGNVAGILAPGTLAERGAAAGLGAAGSVAEAVAPDAVGALKAAGSKAMSALPEAAQSVLARVSPGAAARAVGWGGLGAVQAEGETGGQASAQQLLQSSLGAAATGVLVPPAISALGEAVEAPASRISQAIKGRFPGLFTAADQVKAGIPEPVEPEPPVQSEAKASPSAPVSPPSPAPPAQIPQLVQPSVGEEPPNAQPGPLSSRATQGSELGPAQVAARPLLQGGPNAYGTITPEQLKTSPETVASAPADQTRGVVQWSETLQAAAGPGKTAEAYLNDPPGTAYNDADITRLGQMAKAQQVQMLNAAVPEAVTDPAAQAKFESEKLLHDALVAKSQGAGAEAGRALNARKILLAAQSTGNPDLIDKAMKMTGGEPLTLDQLVTLNKAKASGDPKQIFRAISDLNPPDWADKLHALTRNAMLSSPKSQMTVGLSSGVQNVLRLANIPVRAAIDKGMSAMTGAERTTFMGQFVPAAKAAWEAIPDAASNAYTKLTTGVSPSDLSALEMGRRPVLPGLLDAPERAIGALHQFAYTVAHNSELASQAAKQAIKDGATDVEAGMQKYLQAPSKDMLTAADNAGKDATFTTKLGPVGQKVADVLNTSLKDYNENLPNLRPGKFIVPFVNVGTNIMTQAAKYAGGGLVSGAIKGGETGMADMAKGAIGVPIAAFIASKLSSGQAWGSGPPTTNKAERDRFLREHGGQTNSVVLGADANGNGGVIIPVDRMGEPLNVMFKVMANMHDAMQYNGQHPSDKDAERVAYSFGKSIVDNSYTANLANAMNAMQDPAKGKALVQQMGQQFIPYSGALRYAAQNADTTVRDTRGATMGEAITNTAKSITPGMTQDLPPRRDMLGNVLEREQNLTPWKAIPNENDPYTQQLKDLNVTPPSPPTRLGDHSLSPALQSQLLDERGQQFKQILDQYRGQEGSPYTAVAVKEAMKNVSSQLNGKYRAMAALDAYGLPATQENAQRVGFALGMPWFKNMPEADKEAYLKQQIQ